MSIEQLSMKDWQRLRNLRIRSIADSPDAFGSSLEEVHQRSRAQWQADLVEMATFVATRDGHDVGLARGFLHALEPDAWLRSMWVAPEYRGHHIGEALSKCVIDWAIAQGCSRLLLDVADRNVHAIALYERLGFIATGETDRYPPPRAHIREHRLARLLERLTWSTSAGSMAHAKDKAPTERE